MIRSLLLPLLAVVIHATGSVAFVIATPTPQNAVQCSFQILPKHNSRLNSARNGAENEGMKFHVAPMQCYTNRHLRYLLRQLSRKAVLWTEMEKVETYRTTAGTDDDETHAWLERAVRHHPIEHPLVLQLGGNDPESLSRATEYASSVRRTGGGGAFCGINLNCGCPSVESGGADYGATLMRDGRSTRHLLEAMKMKAGLHLPVSVKCRIGIVENYGAHSDETTQEFPEASYEPLAEWVHEITKTGAVDGGLVVHARTAVLSGLSPVKNRHVPPLRYDLVERLADDFPGLDICLNGGVAGVQHARTLAQGLAGNLDSEPMKGKFDGIMLGRSVLERPLDLFLIDSDPLFRFHSGRNSNEHSDNDGGGLSLGLRATSVESAIANYCDYAANAVARKEAAVCDVAMPLVLVSEQLQESLDYFDENRHDHDYEADITRTPPLLSEEQLRKAFVATWEGLEHIADARGTKLKQTKNNSALVRGAEQNGEHLPIKKLTKLLKQTMGKKVANKVKRNRSENTISS